MSACKTRTSAGAAESVQCSVQLHWLFPMTMFWTDLRVWVEYNQIGFSKFVILQVSAQARALQQREDTLSQAKRDLNVQLDRAELEVSRAERQRQTAVDKCASLQKQCLSLQDLVQLPAQLEGKLQAHGGHRTKRSRADKIQAHLPGHELL